MALRVNMEEDVMEMTKEELQKWIRERIKKMELISSNVLEKCLLLLSLLERREKQAANFLKLCESVAACEAIVKKQYSLLGWEYRDTDSDDDDDNIKGCGSIPSSPCESVLSETQVPSPPATNGPTPLPPKREESADLNEDDCKKSSFSLKRELVVVLTRLPKSKIAALRLPTPQNQYSKHESLSDSDSDVEWEPEDDTNDSDYCFSSFTCMVNKRRKITLEREDDSTDSDFSISSFTSRANKRRKIDKDNEKTAKSNTTKTSTLQASAKTDTKNNATQTSTLQASTNDDTKNNATQTSTLQASKNTDTKSNAMKTSLPQASTNADGKGNTGGTSTPQGNRNTNSKSNTTNTSPKPANTNGALPVCIVSTLCQSSDKATKVLPSVPQEKITVGMNVLARRKAMSWKWGKIMEIVEREDGRLKYKINFEMKGKCLVSGHHIAFHCVPKVDQLYVGARVVVKCQGDKPKFSPGVLAELPIRKNRMRFLVFLDDHMPMYVGLPVLHLVCRPLTDPLDDIPNGIHKNFMKGYMKAWPNPPQTQYQVGRTLNVELNGVQKKCEVLQVDSSLVQVVFQEDQHKEWIYRGSMRLEHMITIRELMQLKKN
ncbi:histone-lysine N-methyltransferase SETDB1-A-like isoform X1 [Thunnus albacares]|uniref:histone-lysine N-methyltransferase SETDB1-A-like isoform X1 n=2 Tax=Thunnus albacares TaxID=8236 RepID=UPI001CF6C069|nr:histone-lysine N-methyltransferase SETDB1-A-like isoform X1 [Thunnus albacares]